MESDDGENPHDKRDGATLITGHPPVRGTQSFVHMMSVCWKRPSLTALEVLWRWAFGIPAAAVVVYEALRVLRATQVDVGALKRMSVLDPMSVATTLAQTAAVLMPPVEIGRAHV